MKQMDKSKRLDRSDHIDTQKDNPELAVSRYLKSMNCAQAVMETYAESMGVPVETALRAAAAFAGGMGMGSICGAVAGAFMVIGMKYGKTKPSDRKADQKTYQKAAEFTKEFKERHIHLYCSKLLGVDMSTETGVADARRKGLFIKMCPEHVRSAVKILDKILTE